MLFVFSSQKLLFWCKQPFRWFGRKCVCVCASDASKYNRTSSFWIFGLYDDEKISSSYNCASNATDGATSHFIWIFIRISFGYKVRSHKTVLCMPFEHLWKFIFFSSQSNFLSFFCCCMKRLHWTFYKH